MFLPLLLELLHVKHSRGRRVAHTDGVLRERRAGSFQKFPQEAPLQGSVLKAESSPSSRGRENTFIIGISIGSVVMLVLGVC